MFALFPVWRESQCFPLVTSLLLLANLLAFAVTWPIETSRAGVVSRDEFEASSHKLVNILSAADSGIDEAGRTTINEEETKIPFPSDRLMEYFQQVQDHPYAPVLSSSARYQWDLEYPVFQSQRASMAKSPEGTSPLRQFGFKANDWWPGILTYQFLHAGFLHLFFNMLFLWAVGSALEQRLSWGLVALYIMGGMAGAAAMARQGMPATAYLVGASAAIACLMGFSLFAMPRAPVKLVYILFVSLMPRFGTFDAPLWFFVPLWLFQQVLMTLMTAKTGSEIGYVAHLGGFAFGAVVGIFAAFIGARGQPEPAT